MLKVKFILFVFCLSLFSNVFSQKGKDGIKTISTANVKVNEFTALTGNAFIGATSVSVAASSLNANARFTSTLTPGDLVMIIQMQGAFMNLYRWTPAWQPDSTYGDVYNYKTCGNYEFAEVKSVISATQIELECGLKYDYSSAGKTQVVRVPRYNSLTINSGGILTSDAWNGTIGGVLIAEVDGNTTVNAGGSISANALGFRGGLAIANGGTGNGNFVTKNPNDGAEKGEGIGSDRLNNALAIDSLGKQCKGAPANGGGGGNANNCGGGGGGNGGIISNYRGLGIANQTFSLNFNLEYPGRASITSSGGGKGGYGTSTTNTVNANSVGPNSSLWGSFKRPSYGGFGGRPLDYSTGKLFMGGGGGAGHMSGQSNGAGACAGGNGGGLIYILNYGTITGTGTITSNGANGANAFGTGASVQGIDGAGGAGAGGTIILQSNGTISSIIANANGGTGGNQTINFPAATLEGQGPGGGGSGGYIAATTIGFTQNVNGGTNGITNSQSFDTEFPMNGATSGDLGTSGQIITPSYSLSASANQTLCTNQSANLTATSTNPLATIQWYNSLSGNSIATGNAYTTPTYTAIGTYTIYAGSCPGVYRLPIIITVNTGATITVNSPTICPNQTVTLTAGGATTYTWSTGPANTNTVSVSPASTTVYTVNATSGLCVNTKTTQVTVLSPPTISVANATICAGNSATLTATGTTTNYAWSPGGQTTSSIVVTPTINSTYSVSGSDGVCTNSTSATVSVINPPTLSVSSQTICAGQVATFTVSGATTYTWQPNNFVGATYTISPASSTTVSVVGDNGSCTTQKTLSVTVNPSVTITVNSATLCIGQNTVLTATSSASSYTWNTGPNTASISVTPTTTTNYTVNGTVGNCIGSKTATVTVIAQPTLAVSGNTAICSGNSTTLTASGTATSFTWMPGNITTSTISTTSTTNYTITGSNGVCTNSTTATVTVTPTPTLTASSQTICAGQAATFTVSGATTYTWNPGGVTGNTFMISPASSTTVSVIGANGTCTSQKTLSVTVSPNPTVSVNNQTICPNQTITLTASNATTYSWNTGALTNTISVSPVSTTIYTVNGTTGLCSDTKTVSVTVASQPTLAVTGNTAICSGNSITLTANGTATSFTWQAGGQTTNSISVNPNSTTTYTVIGSDGVCTNSTTSTVSVTPTPTITGVSNTTICPTQTATFTAGGATSFTWQPTNFVGATYTIAPSSNIVISVIGANGTCTVQTTASITIGSNVSITVPGATICPNQSATLTANSLDTYTWSTTANTNSIVVAPSSTTVYTVTGSVGTCTGITTVTVSVIAQPTLAITGNTAICSGSSTTLTANGSASSYTWQAGGQTTNSISVNPNTTTNYTITGSNGVCTNSMTATVSVTPTPTISGVTDITICTNQTATFTAGGATTYTWQPTNFVGSTYTIAPTSNTVISVIGSNGTCTSSATASITIGSGASVTVNSETICAGQTATLSASGITTYTWNTGSNSNPITVSPTSTTVYTVSGNNGSCSGTQTATVTVNAVPVLTVTSNDICSGQTATLNVSGATTFTWNPGNLSGTTQTVSPTSTTIYTVSGTDLNGCINTSVATTTVNITTTPTITGVSDIQICTNQTATFTAGGATTYTWQPTNFVGATYTIAPTSNTIISVIGANGTCTSSATASITIGSGASVTVNSETICAGQTATLSASGITTYTWNTGSNSNPLTVSPTSTTVYTVSGNNGSCSGTQTATVTVNAVPVLTVNNPNICSGQTATLNVSGADTYTWSNGSNSNTQTVSPTSTTIYTVSGTDLNGCTNTAITTSTVNVTATPTININSPTICAGQTATLTATGATSFTWSTTETTATINPSPVLTTTYSVLGSNGGCSSSFTTTVTVDNIVLSTYSISVATCPSETVALFGTGTNSATTTYTWSNGINTYSQTVAPINTTTYVVNGTSLSGCPALFGTVIVNVNSISANFSGLNSTIMTVGEILNLTDISTGATSILWNYCNGVSASNQITIPLSDAGTCCIKLIATNASCKDSITKCVTIVNEAVVIIPNVFTPNGDNKNDIFKIKTVGVKSLNCVIYDRWGLKLYEWDGINGFWDGTAKAGLAPTGTYFYIINYTDEKDKSTTEKGFLTLFKD